MNWLTGGGVVAALGVGATVTVGLGWRGLILLFAFFVSGSWLTRISGGPGGQRTARQVLANGTVAAIAALGAPWPVSAGALAAATADTWATEIGAFSPWPPRMLTTGAVVSRGVSGGMTLLGTVGGVAGAAGIAGVALALFPHAGGTEWAIVAAAGVAGMLVDSFLGAALQGAYECPDCAARFERGGAVCHQAVRRIRGVAWLDNDGVNLAGTLAGAAAAALGLRVWS